MRKSLEISGYLNPRHRSSLKLYGNCVVVLRCIFTLQVALCGTQVWWTTEVNIAFERLEEGYENALKDYYKKQV